MSKEIKFKNRVYEALEVYNDIVYEAERGKISWEEALKQMRNEFAIYEDN